MSTLSYHATRNVYISVAGPGNLMAAVTVDQPCQFLFSATQPVASLVGHSLEFNQSISIASMGAGVSMWAKSSLDAANVMVTLGTDATITTGASGSMATGGGAGTLIFQDEGVPKGVAATLNVVGENASLSVVDDVATLSITGASALQINDEGISQGTAATINVIGGGASVIVADDTATINVPATTLALYDEGVLSGTATTINVTGLGASVAVIGSAATLTIPGTAIYDEGVSKGNALSINFVGKGVTATNTGGAATVTIPGNTGDIYLSPSGSDDSAAIFAAYSSLYYGGSYGGTIHLDAGVFLLNSSVYPTSTITKNTTNTGAGLLTLNNASDSASFLQENYVLYYGYKVIPVSMTSGGSGYSIGNTISQNGNTITVNTVNGSGTITSFSVGALNGNASIGVGATVVGSSGSGATFSLTSFSNAGSGYSVGNRITFTSAQGGAIITVLSVGGSGAITSFSVAFPGAAVNTSTTTLGASATVAPSGGTGALFTPIYSGYLGIPYGIILTSATAFNIISPNPTVGVLATGTVETPFANQICFTVATGSPAYVAGDSFTVDYFTQRSCIALQQNHQGMVTIRGQGQGTTIIKCSRRCSNFVNMNLGGSGYSILSTFTGVISGTTITVSGIVGSIAIGDKITGAAIATGTVITGTGTGAGGNGTYIINISQTVSSESMTGSRSTLYRLFTMEDFTVDSNFFAPGAADFYFTPGIVIDLASSTSCEDFFVRRVDTKNSHLPSATYPWKSSVSILTYQAGRGTINFNAYTIKRMVFEDCNFCTNNDIGGYGGNYGIQIGTTVDTSSSDVAGISASCGADQWIGNTTMDDIDIIRCRWDSGKMVSLGGTAPTTGFIVGNRAHGSRWNISDCTSIRSWDDDFEIGSCLSLTMSNCTGDSGHYEAYYFANLGGLPGNQSQVSVVKGCRVLYTYFINGVTDPTYSPLVVNGSAEPGRGIPYGHFILEDFEGAAKFVGYIQAITVDKFTTKGRQPQQTLTATANNQAMFSGDNYNDQLGNTGIAISSNVGRTNINLRNISIDDNSFVNFGSYTGCTVGCTALTLTFLSAVNFKATNVKLKNSLAVVSGTGAINYTPILLFYPGSGVGASQQSGSITQDTFSGNQFKVNYVQDAGLYTDFSVSGGHVTCPTNTTTEHRYVWIGSFTYGSAGPFVDACWWLGSTPGATISGHKTGIILKRLDSKLSGSTNYIECYITDNGTNTILNIDKVVAGTRTNLATQTSGTRISNGTPYWVMASIRGNLITLTYRSSAPTNTLSQGDGGTIGAALTYSLTGYAEIYKFGADQLGWGGFSWIPADTSAYLTNLTIEALAVIEGVGIDDLTIKSTENINNLTAITYADPTNMDKWVRFTTPFNLTNFNLIGANATTAIDQTAGLPAAFLQQITRSGQWISNPAAASISVGSSPFTYINTDGYNEDVNIYGGTLTSITLSRNKGTTFSTVSSGAITNFSIKLRPSDQLVITYSVLPTMNKTPLF